MDRLQLKQCLQAAGIPEDRYLLVGLEQPRSVREGACVVRPNERNWEVLIWEPTHIRPSLTFLNEDEACDRVLDILTGTGERASAARPSTAAGPSTPATRAPAGDLDPTVLITLGPPATYQGQLSL
jgi:hypothetical protein